ncbi:hypothetical protein ACJJTC_003542 [Scirpophaga incertulas]
MLACRQQQQHQQQQQQAAPEYNPSPPQYRPVEAESRFFLHDGPAPRRTWAQLHHDADRARQAQQAYQPPTPEPPQRTWKSPSPQPPERTWNPQGFVLHDRTNQPFPVHYNPERYQNGSDDREPPNHLSYTVIKSHSPPTTSSPRRSKTPQRQGSLPESRPVNLQQLQPDVDMEPQNISFIGSAEDDALRAGINRLNISCGTSTYRIPSPTRPSLSRNSFQEPDGQTEPENEKGFYISFDNEQPKRPKPPLRAKRGSPRKERSHDEWEPSRVEQERHEQEQELERQERQERQDVLSATLTRAPRPPSAEPAALVIGELNPDPTSAEEMERKKERIMLLSLQRRARAEEARAHAEAAAAARRDQHQAAADARAARRDEQARRRHRILHQYKLKKARERAEREGKVLDQSEFMESLRSAGGAPPAPAGGGAAGGGGGGGGVGGGVGGGAGAGGARLRQRTGARARPKTIHVDASALHRPPSAASLTAGGMRRDYFRGSQDSLADRAALYQVTPVESPVEERGGASPGSAASAASGPLPLARRGSCKTSRGPRLYKQPTTKSNRGIMLNAVEYCVFPGAVNAEAKRRVLEEVARSDSKHFLVLFRDAGCQFRALYAYCPEDELVAKLYGTGPKTVGDRMFDKFFKYNSGSKCFSQVHTKHLTVTIDAFTIHNSLWQGKKVQLPSKKDMALVI